MKMRLTLISVCAVLCLGFATQNLVAQEEPAPAAKGYKMKNVNASDFKGYPQIYSWLTIDNNNSIVFAKDSYEDATSDSETLISYTLNKNGKPGKANKLLVLDNGWIGSAAAFWNPFLSPPAHGSGVLFVAFKPQATSEVVNFAVTHFAERGEMLGDLDVFFELSMPSGDKYYSNMWLTAAQRDGVIGVVMGVNTREWSPAFSGDRGSELYLAEFSVDGTLLSNNITKVKLPTAGDVSIFRPFTPAWNGKSWLVPAVMTVLKEDSYQGRGYTDEIGYQLLVLRATPKAPGGPFKTRVRKIASDNTKIHWPTFQSPVFLPYVAWADKAEPSAGKTLRLLYTKAAPAGSEGRGINAKLYSYHLQPISAKGKKSGKAIKVQTANWKRLYANMPGLSGEDTYSHFSNAWVRPDKRVAIAHSRSAAFYRAADSSNRTELQLNYYILNPVTGQTKTLAQSNYKNHFTFYGPLLSAFGTKPVSLCISRQELGGKQKSSFFFSKLPK